MSFDPLAISRSYFEAWRQRDARAVLAAFAPGGTYEDPLTGGPIAGERFSGYMKALWEAFPDLDFELGDVHAVTAERVHGAWTMLGHQTGPFNGLPPSGRAVRLPGLDVIRVGADGVRSVTGYFDSAVVPRQLGLEVVVQPREIGPFAFGTGTVMRRSEVAAPGVLAFTELIAAGDEQVQAIRDATRQIVTEQIGNPAFLGFTGTVAGRRMVTVSAWSSHDAMAAALRTGAHAQAMQRFYRDGVAEGGYTSVYLPQRVGPYWRRCGACGAMSRLSGPEGACSECGASVRALA
jgi:steroid delta-isomerase-like uncharacterized protein